MAAYRRGGESGAGEQLTWRIARTERDKESRVEESIQEDDETQASRRKKAFGWGGSGWGSGKEEEGDDEVEVGSSVDAGG